MKNPLKPFDDFFIQLLNQKIRNRFLDKFFYYITNLGGVTFLTSFSILALIFTKGESRRITLEVVSTLLFSSGIVQILKHLFSRNRPYWILKELNTFGIDLSDYSFPSGHTTASFSCAVILSLYFSNCAVVFIFIAFCIAISRIYLAVHYPTDVLAGMIIGSSSALFIHYKLFPMAIEFCRGKFI